MEIYGSTFNCYFGLITLRLGKHGFHFQAVGIENSEESKLHVWKIEVGTQKNLDIPFALNGDMDQMRHMTHDSRE